MEQRTKTGLAVLLATISATQATAQKPNIVFILADDMRATTIGAMDLEDVCTPNLDALRSTSTHLMGAHIMGSTSGAVSMPSRAMLLTGKYLHNLKSSGSIIPSEHTTLGEVLQQEGYTSYQIGKWHSDKASFNRCFNDGKDIFFGGMSDHWNVPLNSYDSTGTYGNRRRSVPDFFTKNNEELLSGEYMYSGKHSVDIFTQSALDVISTLKSNDKPTFLYLAYMSPHDPRTTHNRYNSLYPVDNMKLPDSYAATHPFDNGDMRVRDEQIGVYPRTPEDIRLQTSQYYAMITHLDDRLGQLMAALKATGEWDNTIIVFAADNGLAVGRHGLMGKQNLYEHSTNVPLMVKSVGQTEARQSTELCYMVDLMPTLCQMAGVAIPSSVDGISLKPLLDSSGPGRHFIYQGYGKIQRAIQDGQWKLIEYMVNGVRTSQLFNLKDDPQELTDLINDKSSRKIVARLRDQMRLEAATTNDPAPILD